MTRLFTNYLKNLDKSMKTQNRKVPLFIDQYSTHLPIYNLKNIKLLFSPANCTIVLQPLDLGIISCVKVNYSKLLMRKITASSDEKTEKRYKVNVLECSKFCEKIWGPDFQKYN